MRNATFSLIVLTLVATAMNARADSVVATLAGANPADIVNITDASIHANNLPVYAGQLNWNAIPGSSVGTSFGTYCIDILHDISIGGTYRYDVDSDLTTAQSMHGTTYSYTYGPVLSPIAGTAPTVDAIQDLWKLFHAASLGNGDSAAAFQVDVWEILYGPSMTVTVYNGQGNWQSLASSWLTTVNNQLGTGPQLSDPNLVALVADPNSVYWLQGQDQALAEMPQGTVNSPATPLPASVSAGLVIFGLFALSRLKLGASPRLA